MLYPNKINSKNFVKIQMNIEKPLSFLLEILKSKFIHLLRTILQYTTTVVIHPYLQNFNKFIAQASTISEIYIAHKEFLKKICKNLALPADINFENDFYADIFGQVSGPSASDSQAENAKVLPMIPERLQKISHDLSIHNFPDMALNFHNLTLNQTSNAASSSKSSKSSLQRKSDTLYVSVWLCIYKQLETTNKIIHCQEFSEHKFYEFERAFRNHNSGLNSIIKSLKGVANFEAK